jgi:hypothetical protein
MIARRENTNKLLFTFMIFLVLFTGTGMYVAKGYTQEIDQFKKKETNDQTSLPYTA